MVKSLEDPSNPSSAMAQKAPLWSKQRFSHKNSSPWGRKRSLAPKTPENKKNNHQKRKTNEKIRKIGKTKQPKNKKGVFLRSPKKNKSHPSSRTWLEASPPFSRGSESVFPRSLRVSAWWFEAFPREKVVF